MSQASRRFTDREVAVVLRKASEIDDADGVGAGSGLSHRDLTEIAAEVGISAEAIDKAVATLDRRDLGSALAGAPLVRKAVHAVPTVLREDEVARLIQLVDERTDSTGSVTEALGSVRWTSSDRLMSTRVSFTPGETETSIEVVEKVPPRLRRVFHLVPAMWGAALAGPFLSAMDPSALGVAAGIGLGVAAGLTAGRGAWNLFSRQSERRVRRLAESLADGHDPSASSRVD